MAGSFEQFTSLLREHFPRVAINLQLEDDDPSWDLIGTFQPEEQAGRRDPTATGANAFDFPAGYEANMRIKVMSGGRVAGGTFAGNTLQMMGADTHLPMGQAADGLYLDPALTPLPAYIKIKMILKRILGSLSKNHQQAMAELVQSPADEVAGDVMVDSTRRLRNLILNGLYGDGTAAMAYLNDASPPTVDETAGGVEVTLDNGTWGRFDKGDLIQFTDSSYVLRVGNGASGSDGYCRVVQVDGDRRSIKVQAMPGRGTIQALADNDYLILGKTIDFNNSNAVIGVTEGYESLLINSGTFPGSTSPFAPTGYDVGDHTELKAFIAGTDGPNEDPTMDAVTELLDKIEEHSYPPPRAWISERGVWTLHSQIDKATQSVVQVPMGVTYVASGGVAGPVLSHMENRFQKFTSKRVRPNCIIAINPDTWKKFMPLGDRAIHWVYGTGLLSGFPSIYGPVSAGRQLTELADAPFNAYCEFGCINPRANFRRLGLKAQRDL